MSYIYSANKQARPSYILPLPHYFLFTFTVQFYSEIPNPELLGFHPTIKTLTALTGFENNNNNGFKVHFGVERHHRGPLSPWNQQ